MFCTVSDVNAEYYVAPDGNNDFILPSNMGPVFYLRDVILSAAGTDTSTSELYINGRSTGERVVNSTNLATNLTRQYMQRPFPIPAASRVRFKQVT
jgi:hypothetical protein